MTTLKILFLGIIGLVTLFGVFFIIPTAVGTPILFIHHHLTKKERRPLSMRYVYDYDETSKIGGVVMLLLFTVYGVGLLMNACVEVVQGH